MIVSIVLHPDCCPRHTALQCRYFLPIKHLGRHISNKTQMLKQALVAGLDPVCVSASMTRHGMFVCQQQKENDRWCLFPLAILNIKVVLFLSHKLVCVD